MNLNSSYVEGKGEAYGGQLGWGQFSLHWRVIAALRQGALACKACPTLYTACWRRFAIIHLDLRYFAAWTTKPLAYLSIPQTLAPSHRAQVFI